MNRWNQLLLCLGMTLAAVGLMGSGFRSVRAMPACPARSAAMPVVSWLVDHLDSVTVHRFGVVEGNLVEVGGYPKTSTDPAFLSRVLSLSGSYVRWNGYDSPSPFGAFYYPRWGNWYTELELHVDSAAYYVWMWRSERYNRGRLLVFTFADLDVGTDSQGQHAGEHNFCMASLPVAVIERLERLLP